MATWNYHPRVPMRLPAMLRLAMQAGRPLIYRLYNMENQKDLTIFAQTNFRNENRKFGIKLDDRRRHMYLIGKTGMGKTAMLEHMVLSDIYAGHGLAYIDPHGDTVEKILDFVPPSRVNDVVYFNPADLEYP